MVGFGYDSHKLATGKELIIGGVKIESDWGTLAHSDGDVLIHALVDALLGAAGLGDIGEHYPDTDVQYKNADSSIFLKDAIALLERNFLRVINIDATIILEKPKLSLYKDDIRKNIASICGMSVERVNIKAKTNEKMGFAGRSEGIVAFCVCQTTNL